MRWILFGVVVFLVAVLVLHSVRMSGGALQLMQATAMGLSALFLYRGNTKDDYRDPKGQETCWWLAAFAFLASLALLEVEAAIATTILPA